MHFFCRFLYYINMKKIVNKVLIFLVIFVCSTFLVSCNVLNDFKNNYDAAINNETKDISNNQDKKTDEIKFEGDNYLLIGNQLQGKTLDIHFIDVGQGDAIYIEFPDEKSMLIDGGDRFNKNKELVLNYLKTLDIDYIDYVMLTHTDSDHVGSLDNVINAYQCKSFYMPYLAPKNIENDIDSGVISTKVYEDFYKCVINEDFTVNNQSIDASINYNIGKFDIVGNDYSMNVFCQEKSFYQGLKYGSKYMNDQSPICVLNCFDRKIVFTGDAEELMENRYLSLTEDIDADVLKVSHHGSSSSSTAEFLDLIDVEYAIISCGEDNKYSHPHQETIDRLFEYGVKDLFRTDLNGDIVLKIDSNGNMKFIFDNKIDSSKLKDGFTLEERHQ